MKITAIASSSRANCYVLESNGSRLILEAGVPFKTLSKALQGSATSTAGCLITHEHGDHAKYAQAYISRGIDCYMSAGTQAMLQLDRFSLEKNIWQEIQGWLVYPLEVKHDAADPVGYVIQNGDDRVMFVTDAMLISSKIDGITHMIIECNYCEDIIKKSSAYHAERAYHEHLGLEQVKVYLSEIDRSELKEVLLIHLSEQHSDEKRMIAEVQEIVGPDVKVSAAGA